MCLLILSIAITSLSLAAFATRMCPDFMLMCCSVCVGAAAAKQALPANGFWLPRGGSAMLNIHRKAYEFKTAPHCCVLKEIGKRVGEVS